MTRFATVVMTLLALIAVLMCIASWAGRRTHNAADFILANRRLGAGGVALGYAASSVNAWLLMLVGAAAFLWGICAVWIWIAALLGCAVNMWFIAPRLRAVSLSQGSVTLLQVLTADAGERLQPIVARSAVFIVLVALLLQIGAMLRAAGGLFAADLGLSSGAVVISSIVLVAICTFSGGLRAVGWCDVVQSTTVFVVALFALLPALIAVGGWEGLHEGLGALGPHALDWVGGRSGVVAVAFAAGVCAVGLAMCGQPQAANRLMAARDEPTLQTARWLALAWIGILMGVVLLCGWCASVLHSHQDDSQQALFAIAERLLPPWLAAVMTATLLAALAFSIASQLLVIATCFAVDLKRPAAPPSLSWSRAALAAAAVLAACAGSYAPAGILDHAVFAFTALGAAFGPLLLVRLSGKRIRPGSTLGAIWAGFILTLLFHLLPDSPGDFLERVLPFIASLGIALTGGERRRNPDRADRSQETVHDRVPI